MPRGDDAELVDALTRALLHASRAERLAGDDAAQREGLCRAQEALEEAAGTLRGLLGEGR